MTGRPLPATIAVAVAHESVVSRSRFVTRIAPARSSEEASAVVAEIRRERWDASHHCTARITGRYGESAGSSDDGEPSGTAGMPMLEVLRTRGLTDVVAVVTRYFGGVKLGTGGLIRAYSAAVSDAVDRASLVRRVALRHATVAVAHADAGRIDNLLRGWVPAHGGVLGDAAYAAAATFELWIPDADAAALEAELASASGGALTPVYGAERIIDVPDDVRR